MTAMKPWVLWVIVAVAGVITVILAATSGGESREEKRRSELDDKLEHIQHQLDDIERDSEALTAPPVYE